MPEPCKIAIYRTDDGYLLRVAGKGTLRESPAVRDVVRAAIQEGARVVLDLRDCTYLDSSFLGCLVILHQCAANEAGSFSVLADQSARVALLASVHLDRFLAFTVDCPQSIAEPVALEIKSLERTLLCRHLLDTHRRLADLGGPAASTFQRIAAQLAKELKGNPS